MLVIDGSEGGGQLLRTSLALAAVTGRAVEIEHVRGNRSEPGLKPQHLTALETVASVCDGEVDGAQLGAETVTFEPSSPQGGTLSVDIGTAGSVTLLFESLLPLAVGLDRPLSVTTTGGTEVAWSPPLTTYRRVTLPLCRRFGLQVAIERERTGFYPAGGGQATLHLAPSTPREQGLCDRGSLSSVTVHSRESSDLSEADVATRQADAVIESFESADIGVSERTVTTSETRSTGSALSIVVGYDRTRAGFDALGERGTPAEEVGREAAAAARAFHAGTAAVDEHTADQLLIWLALGGGTITIPRVTEHIETSLDLLATFGYEVTVSGEDPVEISA